MISCEVALVCESLIQDVSTNRVSAININEDLATDRFPRAYPRLVCLFMLKRDTSDPAQVEVRVEFLHEDVELQGVPIRVDFGDKLRNRTIVKVDGLVIPGPGLLRVRLVKEGEELGHYDIAVSQSGGPQAEVEQR